MTNIITIGQGEIGSPLTKMLKNAGHTVYAKDLEPLSLERGSIEIMLVSIPFKSKNFFIDTVLAYIKQYAPSFVVINSTVLPGTTKEISTKSGCEVVHSPVMGRHRSNAPEMMFNDIRSYPKFIGADTDEGYNKAKELFNSIGLKSKRMSSSATSELAKLLETSYSGVLIGWMQEVERLSNKYNVNWKETLLLPGEANKRIEFQRPTNLFPGFIGGHCIMPNIELLLQENKSEYLTAIINSNKRKQDQQK